MPPRDSKRKAVYEAEDDAFADARWQNEFTLAEAQAWLDQFMGQRWFRARWRLGRVTVEAGRGLHGEAWVSQMRLGVAARNRRVILHELAHIVVGRTSDGHASHGPEFAATYLLLIDHEFGADEARRLRDAYVQRNVRHRWAGVQRTARYEVPSQAQARQQRTAAAQVPPTDAERQRAAAVLRRAVAAGHFGAAGSKPRTHALATARALEKPAPAP